MHHIGFVVVSISESAGRMSRALGGFWDGRVVHDPLQQALELGSVGCLGALAAVHVLGDDLRPLVLGFAEARLPLRGQGEPLGVEVLVGLLGR